VIRSSHGADHRRATLPRRPFIAAAAVLVAALAGCEAGTNAPTQRWHAPTDGAGTVAHGIAIRNVFVLGAPANAAIPAGKSAGMFFALVNTGSPDQLLSISAPGTATSVQLPGSGPVRLAQGSPVLLTGPQPEVVLTGLRHSLPGGSFIPVIMNFQNAGSVPLSVPVVPQTQYYSTFSPAPTPTPTASSTRKPKRARGAAATPTPTPGSS